MTCRSLVLLSTAALVLTACTGHAFNSSGVRQDLMTKGDYWQRTSATSAIWTQGPKAQQMLNRDIARCVTELQELVRLGEIKRIFPPERQDTANAENDAQRNLATWDSVARNGALLSEGKPYHDFESCMKAKGWERVLNVKYDTADRASTVYMGNHVDYKNWLTKTYANVPKTQSEGPYKNLNN